MEVSSACKRVGFQPVLPVQKLLRAVSLALGRSGGGPGARQPRESALGWRSCVPWGQPRARDRKDPGCKGKEGGDGERDSRVASMGCKLKRRGWAKSLRENRGGERGQGHLKEPHHQGDRGRQAEGHSASNGGRQ